MTAAEFEQRYQLVRQVTDGRIRTWHAVASTGAVVMVHQVDRNATEESLALADLLGRLDPREKERILDVTEVDGAPVIVTRFILEFTSLRDWLTAHARDEPVQAPGPFTRPAPSEPASRPEPAEPVTRPEPPEPVSETPVPPVADERPASQPAEPGEFTRQFGAARRDPAPDASEPGEFTRQFGAVRRDSDSADEGESAEAEGFTQLGTPLGAPSAEESDPEVTPGPTAAAGESEPGEFTRAFQAQQRGDDPPVPPAKPASGGRDEGPGEFTRMFEAPSGASRQRDPGPAAPKDASPVGNFTEMMRKPPPPPPHTKGTAAADDEGEYTRMLRSASGLEAEGRSPPAPSTPRTPPHPAPPPEPTPPSAPRRGPGDAGGFTEMFRTPSGGSSERGAGGLEQSTGSGEDYRARLESRAGRPQQPAASKDGWGFDVPPPLRGDPGLPADVAPPPRGEGDYTRVIRRPPPAEPPPPPPPPPPPAPPPKRTLIWIAAALAAILVIAVVVVVLLRPGQAPATDGIEAPDTATVSGATG